MRKVAISTIVLLALIQFSSSVKSAPPNIEGWYTNGVLTNPAANAVFAITPALSEGYRTIGFICSYGATGGGCVLTRLASNGSTVVHNHVLIVGINTNFAYTFPAMWNEAGEFWALTNLNLIAAGSAQGSIFVE